MFHRTQHAPARTLKRIALPALTTIAFLTGCNAEPNTETMTGPVGAPIQVAPVSVPSILASSVACGQNQPAGFRLLNNVPLSIKSAPGTGPVILKPWVRAMNTTTDPTRGLVAQFTYATGMSAGRAPGEAWMDEALLRTQNAKDVYFCAWIQPSSNFVGHVSGVNKLVFFGFGKSGNQGIMMLYGVGSGALRFRLYGQGTNGAPTGTGGSSSCGASGCSWMGNVGPSVPRGTWSMVEVLLHSGPLGSKTSWMEGYFNGVSTGRISGYDLLGPTANGTNPRAEKVAISPTWGGTGGSVTASFNLQVSGVVLSGS